MELIKKSLIACCLLALLLPFAGCGQDEGSMEKAGKAVDEMFQSAEDSVRDTVASAKRKLGIREPGPMEKMFGENGRPLDEFFSNTGEFFAEMFSDAKRGVNDPGK